jgi:tRNA wybutosine-synthesizing protein 4
MRDCWLQTGSKWERIQDLPEPRFRHRAAAVVLPDNQYGVVVFGGKSSATKIAIDTLLWDRKTGWRKLRSLRSDPMPRFGASFVRLGFNHGLLFGGMRHDGVICQGLWRWRLTIRDNAVAGITFKTSTALDASAGVWPWLSRLGASYSVIRNELLVVGGVAKHGCIPKDYEILSILGSFSAFGEFEREMQLRVACVSPKIEPGVPRPFLIGHSTHRTASAEETTLLVGGGATCFSFGAYWNPGCWLLHYLEAGLVSPWALVKPPEPAPRKAAAVHASAPSKEGSMRPLKPVECVNICSEQEFADIRRDGVPKILTCLDLGSCVSRWTPAYLISKVPPSRTVVVHSAPHRTMNFQRKDFAYTTVPFHHFVRRLEADPAAHMYLRSISGADPTRLPAEFRTDWPELAPDFVLPPALGFVGRHRHSSPLRVSARVNMWLHYDVMANVLFQIRGTRKLVLFPPEDIRHLSFPPGSTTSGVDVLEPAENPESEADRLKPIPNTHPHVAILRPGEALYIPPLWAHTGTPLPASTSPTPATRSATVPTGATEQPPPDVPTSSATDDGQSIPDRPPSSSGSSSDPADSHVHISLNVFFRSLAPARYAAGRDVYGNRDLAAYEDGRRDVDRIVRRFTGGNNHTVNGSSDFSADPHLLPDAAIPKAVTRAYLERLADELRERAERL